jgi:hypothetical protein
MTEVKGSKNAAKGKEGRKGVGERNDGRKRKEGREGGGKRRTGREEEGRNLVHTHRALAQIMCLDFFQMRGRKMARKEGRHIK